MAGRQTRGLTVAAMVGSLRKDSWNRKLWRIADEVLHERGVETIELDLGSLPHYDGDVEAQGLPLSVAALRQTIREADALVIASPEYNNSVPGFLKNAIDWASRPPNVFDNKPVFVMGVSPSRSGTIRMRLHMETVLGWVGAWVLPTPRVHIPNVASVIAPDGTLLDASVGKLITDGMDRLLTMARVLETARQPD